MKRIFALIVLLVIGYLISRRDSPKNSGTLDAAISRNGQPGNPVPASPKTEKTRSEQLRSLIESDNAPIKFYGLVIDESGSPLSDVKVNWNVLKAGSFAPSLGLPTGAHGTVRTSPDGRFSVEETGSSISIDSLMKSGYRQGRQMQGSYGYGSNAAPHQPDESNPERFLMVKEGKPASKKITVTLKFEWDGSPKEFEMGPKEFSEKIILIPTREAPKPGERDYEWKLLLKAKSGQLVPGKQGDAPLAPESGYTEELVLQKDKNGQRGSKADALIYLKTIAGKYAEFRISAYSDRSLEDSATGYIDVRWNTAGGRTFE